MSAHDVLAKTPQPPWIEFSRQTAISDPGRHAHRLAQASVNPFDLIECIGKAVLNFVTDRGLIEADLFKARLCQVDLRTVEAMLDALWDIADIPLSQPRRPEQRIVGNCRDTALLCAAVLRAHGVPARVRYGFAHRLYRPQEELHEHAVTEFFQNGAWKTIDCRIHSELVARHSLPLEPGRLLPSGLFHPALQLWRDCRSGVRDFSDFGGERRDPGRGMSHLAKFVYQDVASLNGFEPLMWDVWGPALFRHPSAAIDDVEEIDALDSCARWSPYSPQEWVQLTSVYARCDALRVPKTITSCSPHGGLRKWTAPTGMSRDAERRRTAQDQQPL